MTAIPMKERPMGKSDAKMAPTKDVAAVEVKSISVEVPFVSEPIGAGYDGQQCFRCDLGKLTRDQQRKIRAIRRGYILQDRQQSNGGETKSMADAVKALIDSLPI